MTTSAPATPPAPAGRRPPATETRRPQSGPPFLVPVLAFTALTIAYVVLNRSTPHPDASGATVLHYAQAHGTAIRVGSYLLFASAAPMALTAAVAYRRLRALGIAAPGSAITLVGGVLAAATLALSGMLSWTGGRLPADASPALARALADLSFLSGGPSYAMMFALFVAGISVPALLVRLLPRPLAWVGLVVAAAGVVASLDLLSSGFDFLIPVVRFGGMIWLLFAAALLPRSRPRGGSGTSTRASADADTGAGTEARPSTGTAPDRT